MKLKTVVKWWFWSAKPQSENWAQSLIRVSGNLIRLFVITPLFLIAIGALVAVTPNMLLERKERAAINNISISVLNRCSSGPLQPWEQYDRHLPSTSERKELERLRKLKRLRELEAKASATPVSAEEFSLPPGFVLDNDDESSEPRNLLKGRQGVNLFPDLVANECAEEYPLCIVILNKSKKAVQGLTVKLEARQLGRSTNILAFGDSEYYFDAIILPNHAYDRCYKHQKAFEQPNLAWSGKAVNYTVNLADVEDWMTEESESYPLTEAEE